MANEGHLAILRNGVVAWNKWREQHPDIMPDLLGVNLSGADLSMEFIRGAKLSGANLKGANLSGAKLNRADLSEADLVGADLSEADLSEADLSGAALGYSNLRNAVLRETDFSEARLGWTAFGDVDLSMAKGLETVEHRGPSTIGVDTLYRSQGKIPEVFLRGAGLPDEFIAYVGSLVGRPIEFYSCFISYSGKDQEFADRLYEGLQNKGVRCWFAPHDVKAGEKLHEQIDQAIRLHDKLLLILSGNSMNSEWVKLEIRKARQREVKEGKRVLFPIRLVLYEVLCDWVCLDVDGENLAEEIRGYFIPDFSNWKDHDSFQKGFDRLLKDLKSPDAAAKSGATAKD